MSQDVANELAIIQDEIANLSQFDNEATLAQIQTRLGTLHDQATAHQDTTALQAISETWEHAQALAQQNGLWRGTAAGAINMARTIQSQRDELIAAIASLDEDHPLIGRLLQEVWLHAQQNIDEQLHTAREEGFGDAYTHADNVAREQMRAVVADNAETLLEITPYAAQQLSRLLCYSYQGVFDTARCISIGEAIQAELATVV